MQSSAQLNTGDREIDSAEAVWLIYSFKHSAYYGPNYCGYSNRMCDPLEPIGRYTEAEARAEVARVNYDPEHPTLEARMLPGAISSWPLPRSAHISASRRSGHDWKMQRLVAT